MAFSLAESWSAGILFRIADKWKGMTASLVAVPDDRIA
jgi:hypothetical protein